MTEAAGMRIRVRLFARQRELAGARAIDLDLPVGSTVSDAWDALARLHPALADGRPWVRFARNGAYVEDAEPLADGDEVACIPPVSGGSVEEGGGPGAAARPEGPAEPSGQGDRGPRIRWIAITPDSIDDAALARMRAAVATTGDGAVVTFEGRTRETPGTAAPGEEGEAARHAGAAVLALEYEAYEGMAEAVLETIAAEVEARFGVSRIAITHRTGIVPLGEASVAVVVASPHRGDAFEACRYAMDELKARAPIWKSEQFADGSVWIGAPARTRMIEP
jgi:molybdopterin converting factor subunit 1